MELRESAEGPEWVEYLVLLVLVSAVLEEEAHPNGGMETGLGGNNHRPAGVVGLVLDGERVGILSIRVGDPVAMRPCITTPIS